MAQSFHGVAATWQNFYLLVGTAAATLAGLMFVAVTFGSELVTPRSGASVRSFLDPTFNHFVHVLFTAGLMVIPTMPPTLLGSALLLVAMLRASALVRIFRHMREAHRIYQDMELSDWLNGIVLPLSCYLLLSASAVLFIRGHSAAFGVLAAVTLALLLSGVFGAWELMLWLALTRTKQRSPPDSAKPPAAASTPTGPAARAAQPEP
jgi:hypothetical protein